MANHLKDEKAELVCELLCMGFSIRETARIARVAPGTVSSILKEVNWAMVDMGLEPVKCTCGKELTKHRGWCRDRYERSPKRQAFMKRWHQPSTHAQSAEDMPRSHEV